MYKYCNSEKQPHRKQRKTVIQLIYPVAVNMVKSWQQVKYIIPETFCNSCVFG